MGELRLKSCVLFMNISELARQLRVSPEALRTKLPEFGFDIGARAIKIDDFIAERVKEKWREMEKQAERARRSSLRKRQDMGESGQTEEQLLEKEKVVYLPMMITVSDFAKRLDLPISKVISVLMKNGIMASLSENIDFETAVIIAEDLGFRAEVDDGKVIEQQQSTKQLLAETFLDQSDAVLIKRPPVVVVMGHVDHGKTKLLDAIRETRIAEGESGGITQHIGAYQTEVNGRLITFIDTPGHEAFAMMRVRGGQVADVAILVIAADDGIKPQTLESLTVIQKERIPFIVAINKIDKEGADIDRVKKELSEINIIPEDWGGDTICVSISAKQRLHLDELLETVLLVADMQELKADLHGKVLATVIESRVDVGEGPVATVIVHNGILRPGDFVQIGRTVGKVKALVNYKGERVMSADPSMPVKIIGLKSQPMVGDLLEVVSELKGVKQQKDYRIAMEAPVSSIRQEKEAGEDQEEQSQYQIILRADVLGSLEAIVASLGKMRYQEVKVEVIQQGLGEFTGVDVQKAADLGAEMIGFNVGLNQGAKEALAQLQENKKVVMKKYSVIYELLDDVRTRLTDMLPPEIVESVRSKSKIIAVFRKDGNEQVCGGRVDQGIVEAGQMCRIYRNGKDIGESKILEIQLGKQQIKQAKAGSEFGVKLKVEATVAIGDVVETFVVEKRKRELSL